MHLVEKHYNIIDVAFSKALGIWPYDKSRFVPLQNVLVILLTVPHLCLQLSVFITTDCNVTLFVRVMIVACPCMIITLTYIVFMFKSKCLINLHNQIQEDWTSLRDKLETDILEKNAHDNQMYIFLLLWYSLLLIVGVIVLQFFPVMLDVVFPLNEPRPQKLFVTIEYFVFDKNYFYVKVLHEFVFIAICATILFSTSAQLFILFFHAFGMFKIARYRIEYFVEDCVLRVSSPEQEHAICKRIMHAVIAHRRALEFSHFMVSSFNALYCSLSILIVISLSINLYGIIAITTVSKNLEMLVICICGILGQVGCLFLGFYLDQQICNSHEEIFHVTYATSWYLMPVSSQKLILFLLQKTGKEFYVKLGYMFVLNIESFATLINTSLSYVAVMYNVSQK